MNISFVDILVVLQTATPQQQQEFIEFVKNIKDPEKSEPNYVPKNNAQLMTAPLTNYVAVVPERTEFEHGSQIDKICEYVSKNTDKRIVLLRNREVIQWSFLPEIEKKNKTADQDKYKVHEDKWGQETLKVRRPDLKLEKQWTNKFGEHLCEELNLLLGKDVMKPVKKEHYQPDSEVDDAIWEAKVQTFFTSGTAGEKILGCPFKYAEIPDLYSKPLKILCMGGAEKVCREQYGNLDGAKCSAQKKRFLDFFKANRIEYVGATDILKSLVSL
jgi:hypothetical protein